MTLELIVCSFTGKKPNINTFSDVTGLFISVKFEKTGPKQAIMFILEITYLAEYKKHTKYWFLVYN